MSNHTDEEHGNWIYPLLFAGALLLMVLGSGIFVWQHHEYNEAHPPFSYKDRVEVIGGFYKGEYGTVVRKDVNNYLVHLNGETAWINRSHLKKDKGF